MRDLRPDCRFGISPFGIYRPGIPRGIEFAGGTSVIMQFDQAPSVDAVRTALNQHYPGGGSDAVVQTYGDAAQRQIMVRVPQVGEAVSYTHLTLPTSDLV